MDTVNYPYNVSNRIKLARSYDSSVFGNENFSNRPRVVSVTISRVRVYCRHVTLTPRPFHTRSRVGIHLNHVKASVADNNVSVVNIFCRTSFYKYMRMYVYVLYNLLTRRRPFDHSRILYTHLVDRCNFLSIFRTNLNFFFSVRLMIIPFTVFFFFFI